MSQPEEPKGGIPPSGENAPITGAENIQPPKEETVPSSSESQQERDFYNEDPYAYNYDAYGEYHPGDSEPGSTLAAESTPATSTGGGGGSQPPATTPAPKAEEPEDEEEEEMLRMSFLEHLEELRSRIIKALMGVGVAFFGCLIFANELWLAVSAPAADALRQLGYEPNLAQITPMDAFMTIWVKLPMLAALFIASPWILYQAWAFVAPGLYRRERRWAAPFILSAAGLFILGGLFGYFVAFRYGLTFLLGIGKDINVKPVINLTEYFDLFVNVMLGIGLVFEMPVIIFFLTLLRLASPRFLLRNSRYAILIITIIAAIITPTPDVFNLMLFTVPMCLLYFVGCFAGYLLVLHREHRRFPWAKMLAGLALILGLGGLGLWWFMTKFHYHFVAHWPFLAK
jgi:sec-independent protein translocase protein TatC